MFAFVHLEQKIKFANGVKEANTQELKELSKAVLHLKNIKKDDEYGTPKDKFIEACHKYRIFPKVDICASDTNHALKKYITQKQDVFKVYPRGALLDFFMNPPYSKVYQFMQFAFRSHIDNGVNGLILTYAKTDTKFWHDFVEDKAEVHFIKGRLKFTDENGKRVTYCPRCKISYSGEFLCAICEKRNTELSAPYPSCWIIYRSKA